MTPLQGFSTIGVVAARRYNGEAYDSRGRLPKGKALRVWKKHNAI
jgi:hypothetical protein